MALLRIWGEFLVWNRQLHDECPCLKIWVVGYDVFRIRSNTEFCALPLFLQDRKEFLQRKHAESHRHSFEVSKSHCVQLVKYKRV